MTNLRQFVTCLSLSFALPWLVLIVVPALSAQKLAPLNYSKDKDGREGVYPGTAVYRQGQMIYASEGCSQCHTQMIRPSYWGIIDQWKKGWGSDQSDAPAEPTRASHMRDYMSEPYAHLGIVRNGPDLTNAGYRLANVPRAEIHAHLYDPRAKSEWSNMPAFRHLYTLQKEEAGGSKKALKLQGASSPKNGYEVVPTPEAELLVDYLLSLKKDAPIPGTIVTEAPAKK
jgi:cytochrome c oxidase cbb3-type subunit 2